jgi:hypothetical protein
MQTNQMHGLYPIIRRVRRPLVQPDEKPVVQAGAKPVAEPAKGAATASEGASEQTNKSEHGETASIQPAE